MFKDGPCARCRKCAAVSWLMILSSYVFEISQIVNIEHVHSWTIQAANQVNLNRMHRPRPGHDYGV